MLYQLSYSRTAMAKMQRRPNGVKAGVQLSSTKSCPHTASLPPSPASAKRSRSPTRTTPGTTTRA